MILIKQFENKTVSSNTVNKIQSAPSTQVRSFSIDDGDGGENVAFKMNELFYQTWSSLFEFAENVQRKQISLELISWGPQSSLERERKFRLRLFTSSIKREIRHFHVVVAQ